MFDHVIVPLDGSTESARALDIALPLARLGDGTLTLVGFAMPSWIRSLTADLQAAADALHEPELDITVITEVPSLPMGEALAAMADREPGTLIVMSTHGRGRSEALVGSVANSLIRHTAQPVVLVGPECEACRFDPHGLVSVSLDETRTSETVIPFVESWAKKFDANVELVTVMEPTLTRSSIDGFEAASLMRIRRDLRLPPKIDVSFEILHDTRPARAIVDRLEDSKAAISAMATRGVEGLARLTNGSVTSSVVRHSPCPVLVVHPDRTTDATRVH